MKTKAAAYLRTSGTSQIDNDGFPRQREAIKRFAKANGLEIASDAEYRDEAVSGCDDLDNREGMQALMLRIASNGIRVVVVENASRLARELLVQESIIHKFKMLGVTVLGSDGTDLTCNDGNVTNKFIRQVLGAFSELEKSLLVAKLRAARERKKRETGRCDGAKPFGELEGEADTLARIERLYRKPRRGDRLTFEAIAATLNGEQRRTRRGGPWTKGSVHTICKRVGLLRTK